MKGMALVLSAPSGAGKSTLCAMLRREFPDLGLSISCCTRAPRASERDGVDYYFLSRAEFERRREAGEFAEWAEVHGNLYGTPLAPVRAMLAEGRDALFDVDVRGAAQLKMNLPGARFVFILPPSLAELERRLRSRAMDGDAAIRRRLANAVREMEQAAWYDALVLNDDLEAAYDALRAFYIASRLGPERRGALLNKLLEAGLPE